MDATGVHCVMAAVTSCAGEVMRQEGAEAGRRLRLPTVAFRDDSFEGVNEYDEGKQSMTWTLSMLRELL
jgi:hypothetical protein